MRYLCYVVLCLCGCIVGCAQNTSAPVDQPSQQWQTPYADQAAQGSKSDVQVWVINAPGANGLPPDQAGLLLNLADREMASFGLATSGEAGTEVRDPKAGYVIAGLTFNIHTGGSSTGEQSTGAVGPMSAQPGATITQSPEQKPEASTAIPITVAMPGGAASGSAATATGSGSATLTTSQQAELRTVLMKALHGDTAAWERLSELLGAVFTPQAVTEPETQPVSPD